MNPLIFIEKESGNIPDGEMKKFLLFLFSQFLILTLTYPQVNVLRLDQITTKDGLPRNSVQAILQDKYGFIWLSSFSGLYKFDGYEFTDYRPDPDDPKSLVSGGVYNLIIDSLQNFFVTFFDTTYICKYNYDADNFERIERYKLDSGLIQKIVRKKKQAVKSFDSGKFYWEYSDNLLTKRNKITGETYKYCIETPNNQPLINEAITCIFIDKHENLWMGSENQGIYKVNTNSKPFFSYYNNDSKSNILIKDIIRAISIDNSGNIWIGTFYNGVYIYDRKNNKMTSMLRNPAQPQNSLVSNEIRSILCDRNGFVWIGTKEGLSKYNQKTRRFTNYQRRRDEPNTLPHNLVHSIMEDHNGIIWIGTFNGFARYDAKSDGFIAYDPKNTLIYNQVDALIEDRNYNIWVATQGGGVTCLKRKADPFQFNPEHHINSPDDKNTLSNNRVFSIIEDSEGYIWVATEYGLNRLDPKSGNIMRFTQNSGLPDDMIMGLLLDQENNLWISHKKGISRFNTKTLSIRNYSEQDGLQSNEFSENACYRNPYTGELFFGGSNGLNSFYPNQIIESSTIPEVVFTGFEVLNQEVKLNQEVNGRVILTKPILFTNEVILKYSDKSFSIKFAALHYANPKSNGYKFKLEGYNDRWITADPKNDDVWNMKPAVLTIIIRPPWWNNWIAYIVYLLIAATIFYLIYDYIVYREKFKNQVRYEKMKTRKIVELDEMKIQFFTNVSHEFRTPLSLIIDPLKKLNSGNYNPTQAKYYYSVMYENAQALLRLVNQLLDFRKLETGHIKLEIQQADIAEFSKSIFETFSLKAEQRQINYKFFSSPDKIIARFDSDKVEKIVNNLLSNAFKYTAEKGEISLEISTEMNAPNEPRSSGNVVISVRDNGLGISEKDQEKIFDRFYQVKTSGFLQTRGTGIGLSYTKQLVDILQGKIAVQSSTGKGSIFIVKLPIGEIDDRQIISTKMLRKEYSEPEEIISSEPEIITLSEPDTSDKEKHVILIVDDNSEVRNYLKNELSGSFDVIEASNGVEGITAALENVPDIILSDIMMPEVSGLELCKTIKADERTSHIPIVLLTARQSDSYIKEGYEFGADAYITKPFNTSVLIAILNNLLESRKKLKEIFGKSPYIDIKKIAGNSADESFLNNAIETIEESISNPEFNIDSLSDILKMSRRQLTHKIKTLTGQTVLEFVKTVRLNKGAKLLLSKDYSISEISYMLGYNVPANFSRSFSKQFGKTPTEYIESIDGTNKNPSF